MAAFCLAFSPDGRRLACGCADGCVIDPRRGDGLARAGRQRHAEPVGAVAFSPDGTWVTSVGLSMNPATREASVRTMSVSKSVVVTDVLGVLPFVTLGFSADGTAHVASPERRRWRARVGRAPLRPESRA